MNFNKNKRSQGILTFGKIMDYMQFLTYSVGNLLVKVAFLFHLVIISHEHKV